MMPGRWTFMLLKNWYSYWKLFGIYILAMNIITIEYVRHKGKLFVYCSLLLNRNSLKIFYV